MRSYSRVDRDLSSSALAWSSKRIYRSKTLLWGEKEKERDHRSRSENSRLPIFSIASDISRVSFSSRVRCARDKPDKRKGREVVGEKKGQIEERDRDCFGAFLVVHRAFVSPRLPSFFQCVCMCVCAKGRPSYLKREAPRENHAREPDSSRDHV